MFRRFLLVLGVLSLAFSRAASAPAAFYTVTDLGTVPGDSYSEATGINSAGQVVGGTGTNHYVAQAFVYNSGTMTGLKTLLNNSPSSGGSGINDAGQVALSAQTSNGLDHAFLYNGGTMTDLGVLPGGTYSVAYGISAGGQVVGYADDTSSPQRAFLYSGGTMTDLGTFGGLRSWANAINDKGQVVGSAQTSSSQSHAFLYSGGMMTDLGEGGATDININAQVVGNNAGGACLYSNGNVTELGALGGLGSNAEGINDSGDIVGWAETSSGAQDAYIFNDGTMRDLNNLIPSNSKWTLQYAAAINNSGEIVGYGISPSGETHAFLLTPTPEPASVVIWGIARVSRPVRHLFAAGSIGLAGYGLHRRRKAPPTNSAAVRGTATHDNQPQDDEPAILKLPSSWRAVVRSDATETSCG